MTRIRFKSVQDNYRKEYLNIKNNTIRQFKGKGDPRETTIKEFMKVNYNAKI